MAQTDLNRTQAPRHGLWPEVIKKGPGSVPMDTGKDIEATTLTFGPHSSSPKPWPKP